MKEKKALSVSEMYKKQKYRDTSTTQSTPSTIGEYEKQATIYFFDRVKSIYGPKFKMHFPTEDDLKSVRREWSIKIGKLSRKQIDRGLDTLRDQMIANSRDFEWPSIGPIIGLCKSERGDVAASRQEYLPPPSKNNRNKKVSRAWRTYMAKVLDFKLKSWGDTPPMDFEEALEIVNKEAHRLNVPESIKPQYRLEHIWVH